jgi:uncharacterized membrane protein (Fun14 family)
MELLTPVFYMLVFGSIAGYFIGFLIKRISRMAITLGIFVLLLSYLAYINTIHLDLNELFSAVKGVVEFLGPLGLTALASSVPFVGSFVFGLVLGLRRY